LFILIFSILFLIIVYIFIKISYVNRYYPIAIISIALIIFLVIFNFIRLSDKEKIEIFVFGIDGATWNVIKPLIKDNKLANFSKLIEKGSSGNLQTIQPILSPIVWTTVATGKMPNKHGVYGFIFTKDDITSNKIWDIFGKNGKSIGIFNYYGLWKPDKVKGFVIPGVEAQDPTTYPPKFKIIKEIDFWGKRENFLSLSLFKIGFKSLKMGLSLGTLFEGIHFLIYNNIIHSIEKNEYIYRTRIIKFLIKKDFFIHLLKYHKKNFMMANFYPVDYFSHRFWQYREPHKFENIKSYEVEKFHDVIDRLYIEMDSILGVILQELNENSYLFVVSDHGFHATPTLYNKKDYEISSENIVLKFGFEKWVEAIHMSGYIIYTSKNENELKKLEKIIKSIKLKTNNNSVFEIFYKDKNSLRVKSNINLVPHNVLVLNNSSFLAKDILSDATPLSGHHDVNGILLAKGPNILGSKIVNNARVTDITPTILYLKNMPIGKDMDGKIIEGIITKEYLLHNRPLYISSYEEIFPIQQKKAEHIKALENVKEKLRALGYIK